MSFNLIRNSRVFFTTLDPVTGVVPSSGFDATNTFELQVLDGFSFSQASTTETVTLNEAGATPVRGQRSFNTALEAVDFSFSTYMRPQDAGANITAEEAVLWNAMFSDAAIGATGAAWTDGTTKATCTVANSERHQLQKFGLIVVIDGTTFVIDNCVLDTATIDFGLDAIAAIAWTGKGATLRQIASPTLSGTTTVTISGSLTGTANGKNVTAPYIANKLSTVTLDAGIGVGGTSYNVALTGGNITISNNVSYLTPANLGVVNKPATYFTGTRSIQGSLNAYLRSGSGNTGALMAALLTSADSDTDPAYYLKIVIGGSNPTHVDLTMPAVMVSIPSVSTEQVVSTSLEFTAQGSASGVFDVGTANELTVEYYTTNAA
jgi:hypothetical protein